MSVSDLIAVVVFSEIGVGCVVGGLALTNRPPRAWLIVLCGLVGVAGLVFAFTFPETPDVAAGIARFFIAVPAVGCVFFAMAAATMVSARARNASRWVGALFADGKQ